MANPGDNDEALMEKIAQEIGEQQANLDNFNETKEEIQKKMKISKFENKDQEKDFFLMCLKRMIIAEKQLTSRLPILARKRDIFRLIDKHNLIIL